MKSRCTYQTAFSEVDDFFGGFCVTRKYFNEITLVLKLKRKYIIIQPTSILLIVTFLSNSISLYVTQRASGEILQFFFV